MKKILTQPNLILAAALGSLSAQALGDTADDLQNLANTITSDYPAVHLFLEELDSAKIDRLCSDHENQIDDAEELQILLNLSANIQNTSQDICVIRELQSMIGFAEAHGSTKPGHEASIL